MRQQQQTSQPARRHTWRQWAIQHGIAWNLYHARGHARVFKLVDERGDMAAIQHLASLRPATKEEGAAILDRLWRDMQAVEPGAEDAKAARALGQATDEELAADPSWKARKGLHNGHDHGSPTLAEPSTLHEVAEALVDANGQLEQIARALLRLLNGEKKSSALAWLLAGGASALMEIIG